MLCCITLHLCTAALHYTASMHCCAILRLCTAVLHCITVHLCNTLLCCTALHLCTAVRAMSIHSYEHHGVQSADLQFRNSPIIYLYYPITQCMQPPYLTLSYPILSHLISCYCVLQQYMGLRQERDRSPAYGELIQEFFDACHDKYGREVLMQVRFNPLLLSPLLYSSSLLFCNLFSSYVFSSCLYSS